MLHWDEVRTFERAVIEGRVRCGATPKELEIEAADATTYRVLEMAKGRQLPLHVGHRVSADCLVLVDFRRRRYVAVRSFMVVCPAGDGPAPGASAAREDCLVI
jgi:hypothetical protein